MVDCEHEWEEAKELFAITRLNKNGNKLSFLPAVGLPIVLQACKKCGKIRIFTAESRGKV